MLTTVFTSDPDQHTCVGALRRQGAAAPPRQWGAVQLGTLQLPGLRRARPWGPLAGVHALRLLLAAARRPPARASCDDAPGRHPCRAAGPTRTARSGSACTCTSPTPAATACCWRAPPTAASPCTTRVSARPGLQARWRQRLRGRPAHVPAAAQPPCRAGWAAVPLARARSLACASASVATRPLTTHPLTTRPPSDIKPRPTTPGSRAHQRARLPRHAKVGGRLQRLQLWGGARHRQRTCAPAAAAAAAAGPCLRTACAHAS